MFKHDTRIFHPWQLVVMGVCIVMLFGLVGSYDYQDAQASAKLYCDMTTDGSWSSYDKAIDCSYQDDAD